MHAARQPDSVLTRHRSLVLDANILIRAGLGSVYASSSQSTPTRSSSSPRRSRTPTPVARHPCLRSARSRPSRRSLSWTLEGIVPTVEEDTYAFIRHVTMARIEQRDPDDWTFLATAIVMHCPIWTEDQEFFGAGVATWTTDRVEIYLSAKNDRSVATPSESLTPNDQNRSLVLLRELVGLCPPELLHCGPVVPDLRHMADLVALEVHVINVIGRCALSCRRDRATLTGVSPMEHAVRQHLASRLVNGERTHLCPAVG